MHTQPSGSTSTTAKSKTTRGPIKPLEGRYIISEFDPAIGKPLGKHATKYKYHCGYLIRERIPITCREWKFKKSAPHISYVSDVDKRLIWDDIQLKFTFEIERYHDVITHEQLVAKVYN